MAKTAKRGSGAKSGRDGRSAPAAVDGAVRSALAGDVLRIVEHEPAARRFRADGVHQMRVGARRLRADLKLFRPLLDDEWTRSLRDELRWLAGALGSVRDLDVLEERFRDGDGGGDAVGAGPVLEAIERRRREARSALIEAMDSNRFDELRHRIIAAARRPEWADRLPRDPARALLDRLKDARRTLRKSIRSCDDETPPDRLHEIRKHAKRCRYAAATCADAFGGDPGRDARRLAKRARRVQDRLGKFQDAAVAEAFLDELLGAPDLAAGDRAALEAARDEQRSAVEAARAAFLAKRKQVVPS